LTDTKCPTGNVVKAYVNSLNPVMGCYVIKNEYVFIIWNDKATSLFKTTDFKPYLEL